MTRQYMTKKLWPRTWEQPNEEAKPQPLEQLAKKSQEDLASNCRSPNLRSAQDQPENCVPQTNPIRCPPSS